MLIAFAVLQYLVTYPRPHTSGKAPARITRSAP